MSRIYLDTGALVKLYFIEPGSEFVQKQVQSCLPLPLNALQETELHTALAAAVGRGILTQDAYQKTLKNFESDQIQGIFRKEDLDWDFVWLTALKLTQRHTHKWLCRTLDILHVAAAESIHADLFISGDHRQLQLCQALSLRVTAVPTS